MKILNNQELYSAFSSNEVSSSWTLSRWNLLAKERTDITKLRDRSSGHEQAAYRKILESCTNEMEQLIPLLVSIFKHIKKHHIMKAIIAIYFANISCKDWADTCGKSADELYHEINETLEEIDREILKEAD